MKIIYPIIGADTGSDAYFRILQEQFRARGVDTDIVCFPRSKELFPCFYPFSRKLRNLIAGADIVHTNLEYAGWFRGCNKPLISTLHHNVFDSRYRQYASLAQKLHHDLQLKPRMVKGVRVSDEVVFVSEASKKSFETTFASALSDMGNYHRRTITNAIDTGFFNLPGATAGRKKQVLIVGSVSSRKGADLLGSLRQQLSDDIEILWVTRSSIEMQGATFVRNITAEKLRTLYQESLALVSLSRLEGFGYSVVEAMACGTPVVVFDHSSFADIVDNGVNGYLCPCEDVNCMAERISTLASNSQEVEKLGSNGRQKAVEKYSLDKMVDSYMALYRQFADRK